MYHVNEIQFCAAGYAGYVGFYSECFASAEKRILRKFRPAI